MLREIPPASFSQRRSLESVSCDASGQEPEKGSLSSGQFIFHWVTFVKKSFILSMF